MNMKSFILPTILAATFVVAGCEVTGTPDEQAQARQQRVMLCTAARAALIVAQNHGLDPDQIAAYGRDVTTVCSFLTPTQAVAAESAAETVAE